MMNEIIFKVQWPVEAFYKVQWSREFFLQSSVMTWVNFKVQWPGENFLENSVTIWVINSRFDDAESYLSFNADFRSYFIPNTFFYIYPSLWMPQNILNHSPIFFNRDNLLEDPKHFHWLKNSTTILFEQ